MINRMVASIAIVLTLTALWVVIVGIPIWVHFYNVVRDYWGF